MRGRIGKCLLYEDVRGEYDEWIRKSGAMPKTKRENIGYKRNK